MTRLVLFLLVLAALPASAQVGSLPPHDQGAQDPSFIAFRAKLLAAAAARDTTTIFRAFDSGATISFGGHYGPQGLRDLWFGPDAMREPGLDFWSTFARTLAMGSTVQDDIVSAPYLFMAFPERLDVFSHLVVVGENVRVRAEPSTSGHVLGSLTYQIVPTREEPWVQSGGYTWVPIRLAAGEDAWVADDFTWSPVGYRIGFEKRDGAWRILYFVAGD